MLINFHLSEAASEYRHGLYSLQKLLPQEHGYGQWYPEQAALLQGERSMKLQEHSAEPSKSNHG